MPADARPEANPWEVELRLARPQARQGRYWVVWTRGEVTPAAVELDAGRRHSTVARACETIAYNTATSGDEPA
eukprot:5665618-Lingulodinium_polyedra.AAC.1